MIDFECAKPNATQSANYDKLQRAMVQGTKILDVIGKYKDGGKKIRGRLMGCKDAAEQPKIFIELLPYVQTVKDFHDFAESLGDILPLVAKELIKAKTLEHQQAFIKLFADSLDFIRRFDLKKTFTPEIQNDFAYYKRSLGKFGKVPEVKSQLPLNPQDASMVSMFLGPSGPMVNYISRKLSTAFPGKEQENLTMLLANIANILCSAVMQKKMSDAANTYCLGAMTGAIVMYDLIAAGTGGVFAKDSKIDMKACCKMIKGVTELQNCVRYSTRSYNSTASDKIRSYIE